MKIAITLVTFLFASMTVQASHRVLMFNDKAMDMILDMWPDVIQSINDQARGLETPGERAIMMQGTMRRHLNQLLIEQATPMQFGEGFKILAHDTYLPSGMTAFGSRLDTNTQVTAFNYLLRKEGRLPIRFAYGDDLARQPIPAAAIAGLYETIGVMWQTIEANPWLWMHGMSSEGDWDAPNRGCLGDDLPVKPGADRHEVKEVLEICPDFSSPTVQALMRGLRSGWRFVGVHGVGSHALRLFIQKLEEQMKRNPGVLTLDYVRDSRYGFAHGTLTGAVPDVVAGLKKYNIYLPINARRALDIEPDNIRQHYGEPGWAFLAPVRTLLDEGVKVTGEAEINNPTPETYFDILDVYVNREVAADGWPPDEAGEKGEVFVPEEAIGRVEALKLFTHRSSEYIRADSKVGSLEVGKYADFVVIKNDYLKGPDREIRNNKVMMTVLAGEIEYEDPAVAGEK